MSEKILVPNRGEIAIRIIRAAAAMGHSTVAVHTADDARSAHASLADERVELPLVGVAGYLDIEAIIKAAVSVGATAVHPGYGFLAENADFGRRCERAGLTFIGPGPDLLELFGDKVQARKAAADAGITVLAGSDGPADLDIAADLLATHGAVMLKAVAGGGGRGMRAVRSIDDLAPAWERCVSEAGKAFGNDKIYVEQLVDNARHIEVQIVGDGSDVIHLGERDCSVQRRNQKLLEIAPAPGLSPATRDRICDAAVTLGRSVDYRNVGTVEFLLDATDGESFWFIETNPRIQVEHTITEQITGIDLVETQLAIAGGSSLGDLGLLDVITPTGCAIQARINAETIDAAGQAMPTSGTVTVFEPAAGPGVRIDTACHVGFQSNPNYDSLLAKLIVHHRGGFDDARSKLHLALRETTIDGLTTNLGFLLNLVSHPDIGAATTSFVESNLDALRADVDHGLRRRIPINDPTTADVTPARAGVRLESNDPLAVLDFGQSERDSSGPTGRQSPGEADEVPEGMAAVRTPLQGTVVTLEVVAGDEVRAGQLVAVVEAMKMEHEVVAPASGLVHAVSATPGETLWADQILLLIAEGDVGTDAETEEEAIDLDEIRPSLAEVLELRARMMDEARPDAVERRRKTKQRTARENLTDLVDDGTFVEYGPMALAAQRRRRTRDDLIKRSPADGLLTGVASVNGELFDDPTNRCAVMIYDYTVFAGTQGVRNHAKTDRIIDVATEGRMPFILYAEGGGGRPGDTDGGDFGSRTFSRFATMSGLVPMVGVVSGYCFAGNASLLGCCDVIIATKDANIGMGGPAMIEGGGLGIFRPEEIGPAEVHTANGVIDVLVEDEAEATEVAKKYLSYFQGPTDNWEAHDQRYLRRAIPENRLRTYDVRQLIEHLADVDSVLEIRKDFGVGIVTSFIRVEGRPMGLIANNPNHLGGAIDSDGSDKGARFMQLCDAFDVPVLFLCDTPGIMVGPEVEKTALVRHANRMFLIGANLEVPTFTVIIRKAYGLGGIAMAGGSFKAPVFSVAWPTAEFGPMGLEGSVKLGFRAELAAIEDPDERKARYDELVEKEYQRGKALNHATGFAVDDTIDPAETRHWLANVLKSLRPPPEREGKKRSAVDGW
ncbi:MAG: acetyl/propionyl-CoA carboxylase alpha subunit/acetyl-CoA carboxylase carboxyltransferase component [Acidimicrobiales bacterium]|jgi:acetyl/propionyl-CoA carboxylase alpha subunit/acetyl-CoA carboxylase carboxyltransferase component